MADAALACGHEVRVVPSTLVHALGVGARRTRTDQRDARALSEASCRINLPSVHIPSARSREWKAICGVHDVRSGAASTFAERERKLELEIPAHLETELRLIELVSAEIKASEDKLESLASQDPVCANAHRVEAYLGLAPGENSSSERQQLEHHQGRTGHGAVGPGPDGVGRAHQLPQCRGEATATLGTGNREAPRQPHRDGGAMHGSCPEVVIARRCVALSSTRGRPPDCDPPTDPAYAPPRARILE